MCSGITVLSRQSLTGTNSMVLRAGFEPATYRLSTECSTAELPEGYKLAGMPENLVRGKRKQVLR